VILLKGSPETLATPILNLYFLSENFFCSALMGWRTAAETRGPFCGRTTRGLTALALRRLAARLAVDVADVGALCAAVATSRATPTTAAPAKKPSRVVV
jgi:hypothetical protein